MAIKTNDELAIEKTLEGDKNGFTDLVLRHQMSVMRLCHFVCGDVDTARINVKRSFLAFANNMVNYRSRGDMHPVLIEHCTNELLMWIRRGEKLVSDGSDYEDKLRDSFYFPAEDMARLESRSLDDIKNYSVRVAVVMKRIPARVKLIAGLKIFEGLSFERIGQLVNIPVSEVRSAMAQFREYVLGKQE